MTKEELKALGLSDEQVTAIVEDYGKNYVAKSQFNNKNDELKQAKGEVETLKSEIDGLKKSNKDNAELVSQIDKLKADAKAREEEYNGKVKQMQIDSIVERALLSSKAKNSKSVRALLNLENAEIDGDTIKGLDAQIKALQKSDGYLFDTVKTGTEPGTPEGGSKQTITKEQFDKMPLQERQKLFVENEELYNSLTEV